MKKSLQFSFFSKKFNNFVKFEKTNLCIKIQLKILGGVKISKKLPKMWDFWTKSCGIFSTEGGGQNCGIFSTIHFFEGGQTPPETGVGVWSHPETH